VKICGVTTAEAVAAAAAAGADAVGFVLADSPRRVSIERAVELARTLPPFVARVAVFRHPAIDEVEAVLDALAPDWVQSEVVPGLMERLERRARLLEVVHDGPDLPDRIERDGARRPLLLEAEGRGGRGVRPDWERAARIARAVPLVLAGGLDETNVAEAIERVRPYAVDVSSGVESSPGIKSAERIERFVAAVRRAHARSEP
jgi:phosphoribosylanthranilate isomerase